MSPTEHTGTIHDPGWIPAFRAIPRTYVSQLMRFSTLDRSITALRSMLLVFIVEALAIGAILGYLMGRSSRAEGWVWLAVIGAGISAYVAVRVVNRRELTGDTDVAAFDSYWHTKKVAMALAMAPLPIAFILTFASDSLLVYLVAFAFATPSFVEVAPTREDVADRSNELAERHLSLLSGQTY